MLAPFLQEIGIASGLSQYLVDRLGHEGYALFFGRLAQRVPGGLTVEAVQRRELEQSFGIGPGATGLTHE